MSSPFVDLDGAKRWADEAFEMLNKRDVDRLEDLPESDWLELSLVASTMWPDRGNDPERQEMVRNASVDLGGEIAACLRAEYKSMVAQDVERLT